MPVPYKVIRITNEITIDFYENQLSSFCVILLKNTQTNDIKT